MSKGILIFEHGGGARLHGTRVQLRPVYKKLVDAGYRTTHSTRGQGKARMMLMTAAPLKVAKEIMSGHRTLFNMAKEPSRYWWIWRGRVGRGVWPINAKTPRTAIGPFTTKQEAQTYFDAHRKKGVTRSNPAGNVRVKLLTFFWGHKAGTVGYIDRRGKLRLKGSPPATVREGDYGRLFSPISMTVRKNDNGSCVVCGGELIFLGGLGNLTWFRCRACGMEQSRKVLRKVRKNNDTVKIIKCVCGARLELYGDTQCDRCGQWYNQFGQKLKDPSQWEKNPKHRRELSVFDKHQLRIAYATLKMSDVGARVMGGPTKEEAKEIIRRLTGKEPPRELQNPRRTHLNGAPGAHEDRAAALEKQGRWLEAAKEWERAAGASIGHARRERYGRKAEYCRRMAHGYPTVGINRRSRKNPIESTGGGGFVVTGKATQLYRLIALKHALKLELATGMKMSRGISPFAIVKREFGFKGNKQKIYDQLVKYIEQVGPGLAQNPGRGFTWSKFIHRYFGDVKYWNIYQWDKLFGRKVFIAKVRATYPEIKKFFPGAFLQSLDGLVGQVTVLKKSQVRIPAKVRK